MKIGHIHTGCSEETVTSFVSINALKLMISKGFVQYLGPTVHYNLVTTFSTPWKQLFSSFVSKFPNLSKWENYFFTSSSHLLMWVPGHNSNDNWWKCSLWWCSQDALCWGFSSGQPLKCHELCPFSCVVQRHQTLSVWWLSLRAPEPLNPLIARTLSIHSFLKSLHNVSL